MSSMNEQLQEIAARYERETGASEYTTREVIEYAFAKGWWKPQPSDVIAIGAKALSDALRLLYFTDPQGRRARAKHAAPRGTGKNQMLLWADMRKKSTSREHMELAFQTRRMQIVADAVQLDTDKESYNENYNPGEPLQLEFDLRPDVEEAKLDPMLN